MDRKPRTDGPRRFGPHRANTTQISTTIGASDAFSCERAGLAISCQLGRDQPDGFETARTSFPARRNAGSTEYCICGARFGPSFLATPAPDSWPVTATPLSTRQRPRQAAAPPLHPPPAPPPAHPLSQKMTRAGLRPCHLQHRTILSQPPWPPWNSGASPTTKRSGPASTSTAPPAAAAPAAARRRQIAAPRRSPPLDGDRTTWGKMPRGVAR